MNRRSLPSFAHPSLAGDAGSSRARLHTLGALALAVCTLSSTAAHAGRTLDEPARLERMVKSAARAQVEAALAAEPGGATCQQALEARGLSGLSCRARVAAALAHSAPLSSRADVDARHALFLDFSRAAASVSSWEPLEPFPGLSRARFEAHRALSQGLMRTLDDFSQLRSTGAKAAPAAARADELLRASPSMKDAACTAAQRSVELATGAGAAIEEQGAAQALVTSHACFLDESRLKVEPKPGMALQNSDQARSIAAETSRENAVLDYARTRSLDIARCEKHLDAAGAPKDAAKLEQCVCGVVKKWKLPPGKESARTTLPVSARVSLGVELDAAGALVTCGPLQTKP